MKYGSMEKGMWLLFVKSFRDNLVSVLGFDGKKAHEITGKAKEEYRKIIEGLPEFEKGDRFKTNILSCAMLASFCLSMGKLPSTEKLTEYYEKAMMIRPMKLFCRKMGRRKFTESDIKGMKKTAARRWADRNPYSWNMWFLPYEDGSGYEARFFRCGICTLMKELGLYEVVPAMCHLDYVMAEAGGSCDFVRRHTLASGGPYCDCGYKKKV